MLIAVESKSSPLELHESSNPVILVHFVVHSTESVRIVNLQGLPSKEFTAELVFDFPIETLGNVKLSEKHCKLDLGKQH